LKITFFPPFRKHLRKHFREVAPFRKVLPKTQDVLISTRNHSGRIDQEESMEHYEIVLPSTLGKTARVAFKTTFLRN